jgi:hypothetical protein
MKKQGASCGLDSAVQEAIELSGYIKDGEFLNQMGFLRNSLLHEFISVVVIIIIIPTTIIIIIIIIFY